MIAIHFYYYKLLLVTIERCFYCVITLMVYTTHSQKVVLENQSFVAGVLDCLKGRA